MQKDNELWMFALTFYGYPNSAKMLLALQDKCALNVNILIYTVWLASKGQRIIALPERGSEVDAWHMQVVQPLRLARNYLKIQRDTNDNLNSVFTVGYKQLLEAELAMEKIELALLFEMRDTLSRNDDEALGRSALIKNNLLFYFKNINLRPPNREEDQDYFTECELFATHADEALNELQSLH